MRSLWARFRCWVSKSWKSLIESYVRDKERGGPWSRYGVPAAALLLIVSAVVGNLLRFRLIPAPHFTLVGMIYLVSIFTLSAIVVATSVKAMGKSALPMFIIALIAVSIAILVYLLGQG